VSESSIELADALSERRSDSLRRDAAELGEERVVVDEGEERRGSGEDGGDDGLRRRKRTE
jgi:hypothetical protein